MLPSGNDAAITLAEHFGQYLFEVATRYKNNKAGQQQSNNGQPTGQPVANPAAQVAPANDPEN
jgi:hypothetical protein